MRFVPVVGFLGFVVLLAALLIGRPDVKPGTADGVPLPSLGLTAFKGKAAWNQEALKGRVTVLNFFASWCAPCEAEMPELVDLKRQFPELDIRGVAWNDEGTALTKWLTKHGEPFDSVWIDNKGEATIALGIKGIPETLVVDQHGIIRYRLSGPLTVSVRAHEIAPLVEKLLAEGAHAK